MFFNLQLLLVITAVLGTDGYYTYRIAECLSSSSALTDVVFIDTYYFNKDPYARFNSTVGEFVGFTEFGVHNAERWNKGPEVQQEKAELERVCKHNLEIDYSTVLDKAVKPKVQLKSELQSDGSRPALLMCSAYDFYPPVIKISWLRDGQKVTSAVTSTEEMPEGDWYYQIHSHLEYTPKSGEKISCVVEHASFQQPMVYDWDPSLPESERNKVAIGASGLVLGIVLSAAGFIYYKKKSTADVGVEVYSIASGKWFCWDETPAVSTQSEFITSQRHQTRDSKSPARRVHGHLFVPGKSRIPFNNDEIPGKHQESARLDRRCRGEWPAAQDVSRRSGCTDDPFLGTRLVVKCKCELPTVRVRSGSRREGSVSVCSSRVTPPVSVAIPQATQA
ncbi:hypothetical protein P4O66_017485 [Electrophorus voltai]|uniref:Ig-like domain-containing protein n=1 Tax=Electrophorus voltai TaxID=2609070 RepID=A0AAD9DN96_9TELE|nr:hypothetical protein P4O66_017485 [Electrophorus voltai]